MLLRLSVVAMLFLPPFASAQNIVIVVIDDAGIERFGTYARDYNLPGAAITPTIDEIADQGVRFDNFWAQPVCSPFRASLMTGLTPWQHGVGRAIDLSTSDPDLDRLTGLEPSEFNIARMVKTVDNYWTEAIGKWHVAGASHDDGNGNGVKTHPIDSGFDYFDGSLGNPQQKAEITDPVSGYNAWERCYWDTLAVPNQMKCELQTEYSTSFITDRAIECIRGDRRESSQPFLCYVAYHAAHAPFHDPPDDLHDHGSEVAPRCNYHLSNGKWGPARICHKAMIQALDRELDRLVNPSPADDHPGIDFRNTTLFVVADNGTMREAGDGAYPSDSSDGGHYKETVYQGGVNTPLIVKGEAVSVTPGSKVDDIVQATDIFATIAEMVGWSDYANHPRPDSVSLLSYLNSSVPPPVQGLPRTAVMAEVFGSIESPPEPNIAGWSRATRDARYKLIWKFSGIDGTLVEEFYDFGDTAGDPEERFDENSPVDPGTLTPEENPGAHEAYHDRLRPAIRPDADGDTVEDDVDDCPGVANVQGNDGDGDGIGDACDNCLAVVNSAQHDSDGDGCGNYCDADYDNSGIVGLGDFGTFMAAFDKNREEKCHIGVIPICTVGLDDFGFFIDHFGESAGPSARSSTVNSIACRSVPPP